MATGDQVDFVSRVTRELPKRWFGDDSPVLSGALAAFASVGATCYAMVQFARAQMRLGTMSGGWLDLFALDYFGFAFPRGARTDDQYRSAIAAELLRERVTRAGISKALENLTGRTPKLFEPWNPGDMGAIGVGTIAIAGQAYAPSAASGVGIAVSGGLSEGHLHIGQPSTVVSGGSRGAGGIGSTALPWQIFVDAYRPAGRGIPNVLGIGYGGIDAASMQIVDDSMIKATVSDAEIYANVARTKAAGVTAWVAIHD